MEGSIWGYALVANALFFILVQPWDSYYSSHSPIHYRKNDGLQYHTGFSR